MSSKSINNVWPLVLPSPGGAGLGVLCFPERLYVVAEVLVCQKFRENYFFSETCATMPPMSQFGNKKRNLLGVKLGKSGSPKPFFCGGGLRWPHNLDLGLRLGASETANSWGETHIMETGLGNRAHGGGK